jgi:Tol biopolymer transport system component
MSDVREVFEMITKQVEPQPDTWDEQERRQSRSVRNRRNGGFAIAALIALVVGSLFVGLHHGHRTTPAHPGPSVSVPPGTFLHRMVIGLDGTIQRQVPGLTQDAESLAMSPDGRTIAFAATKDGLLAIGTIGMDGAGLRFLSHMPSDATSPAWSPDGSRIAFVAQGHIYVMAADGSQVTQLTSGSGVDQVPTWSPDETTIAYSNLGAHTNLGTNTPPHSGFTPTEEIWTVPASGGTPTRLTQNRVPDDTPSYSPDGTRIAFFHDGRIWIMDRDGRNAHPMPGQPRGANFAPRWSPDGSRILFLVPTLLRGDAGPLLTLHVVDLATGASIVVPGKVEGDENVPSWLPSGTALLINQYPVA